VSIWRPAVVIPVGLRARLGDAGFACALRHELAHLARGDQVSALAVALLKLPLALHPTARALARELALAREEAVDAAVAPADRHTYARTLVAMAERVTLAPGSPGAVCMSATALGRRITMIIEERHRPLARFAPSLVAALVLSAGIVTAAPVFARGAGPAVKLNLAVGEHRTLDMSEYGKPTRLALGDPRVARVSPRAGNQIEVDGEAAGHTQLHLWTDAHRRVDFDIDVR